MAVAASALHATTAGFWSDTRMMTRQQVRALIMRDGKPMFESAEVWAAFIEYRERLGLTFAFQTAQECIDAFTDYQMSHWPPVDIEPHDGDQCHQCGLACRACCCKLNEVDRAYNT